MNFKKLKAGILAAALGTTMLSASYTGGFPVYASEKVVENDFEVSYEGWFAENVTSELTAIEGVGYDGSRGMKISGRKDPSDCAMSEKGFYIFGGDKYSYSVMVKADEADTFKLTVRWIEDPDTEEYKYKELDTEKVKAGEWVKLSGDLNTPDGAYNHTMIITTDSTQDFYFDNVEVSHKVNKNAVSAAPAGKGLKDEFANYFRVGNILNGGTINNSGITGNILKDCNVVECENETKPDATLVQNGSSNTNINVRLDSCAKIADFCEKNGIGFRGHTFVWHSQTPVWFFKENFNANANWVSKSVMDQRLESYIKNMFAAFERQYPNLNIFAYDVCNECVSDDSNRTKNNGGAREPGDNNTQGGKSGWVAVYGDNSFIEKAFTYARQYAPANCKLYYNDYNEYWDHKRDCIINTILKPLSAKGVLDGMGMQSHINADASGFSGTSAYLGAMDMFLNLGIDVQVTELDISTEGGKFTLQQQAEKYKAIFQHAMDANTSGKYKGRVTLIQIWGPNDANSWVGTDKNSGKPNSPLLYDSNNQPKLAYTTLTGLLSDSEWGDGSNPNDGSTPAAPPEPNEFGWWFNCGFEGTTDSFESRGGTTIKSSSDAHYQGSNALEITGRTDTWNAAQYSLSPRIFKAGETYSFSAHAMYKTGSDTETFKFTLEYTGSDGEGHWEEIATSAAVPGKWVQLSNANFKIPDDATNMKIYVETIDSTIDFYIDEVIGATGGTGIAGEGGMAAPAQPGKDKGDLNGDGIINVFDLCLAKKALKNGATSAIEKAADVDGSRVFDKDDVLYIQQYIVKKIDKFPVATSVIPPVDTTALAAKFSGLKLSESYKKDGENNVLYTQRFGADPGWMVYDGRLYVYTTNDAFEYDNNGQMKENSYDVGTINCISSADLVNWTDHGPIPVAGRNGRTKGGVAAWASCSWAPDACWKKIDGKDKFFLYFANNGSGVGVLTADSPTGPWKDPIGKELISRGTPTCNTVTWLFDPGVYYDEKTDKGYIAFGGGVPDGKAADPGTGRIVELGSDMTSIVGTPSQLNPPYLFEDSSLIKIGDNWVYSFCHNWNVPGGQAFSNADIGYMTATNPLGPYTYKGVVFKNTGSQRLDNGGNNHHSIVEFKGKYYVLYHTRQLEMRMGVNGGKGLNYRSPAIDSCTVNGTSLSCNGSMAGVAQLEALDPYTTVQAETMSNQTKGIVVNGLGDTTVVGKAGEWIKVSGVNFSNGAVSATLKASSKSGAVIRITTGKADGDVVGYAEVPAGGTMSEITVPVENVTGKKDLYFTFSGELEFDSWSFE